MEIKKSYEDITDMELRIVKLLPHSISEEWPMLRRIIEVSLPRFNETPDQRPERMTRILEGLLSGSLELHAAFKLIRGMPIIYGFILLSIVLSVDTTHTDLLIHSFYGHRKMIEDGDFKIGFDILERYAKSKGCTNIVTYARREFYQEFLKNIGFNTDFVYAIKEV